MACGGVAETDTSVQIPGQPPPVPSADSATGPSANVVAFALDELFVGENGTWESLGYDLDHKATTKISSDVCTLLSGSSRANQIDGTFGIDNAWGSVVVPILQSLLDDPLPSEAVTNEFASGASSPVFVVNGYRDGAVTALGLGASAFLGQDGAVQSKTTSDGATLAGGAKTEFANVYQNGGKLVAKDATAPLEIDLPITTTIWPSSGTVQTMLELDIHDAVVTFDQQNPDGSVNGTIAGVLVTTDLVKASLAVALDVDPQLCTDEEPFAAIADQIVQASDILSDGTNKSGVLCNAISIGLAFHAKRVATPTTVVTSPTRVSCN